MSRRKFPTRHRCRTRCGRGRPALREFLSAKNLVQKISRPQDADDADEYPKSVEHDVGGVALDSGTPGEHDGIGGVENPHEHERAGRAEPTHEAETDDAHQYADHLDGLYVAENKRIHAGIFFETVGLRQQNHICRHNPPHCSETGACRKAVDGAAVYLP